MDIGEHINKTGIQPDDPKLKALYDEYLQKCCEIGQIEYQIDQLENQKRMMEKELDKARRARNNASNAHRDLLKARAQKLKLVKENEPTDKQVALDGPSPEVPAAELELKPEA